MYNNYVGWPALHLFSLLLILTIQHAGPTGQAKTSADASVAVWFTYTCGMSAKECMHQQL